MSFDNDKNISPGNASAPKAPILPPNVKILSPSKPSAAEALLNGGTFTRLTVSAQVESARLAKVLAVRPEITEAFCLSHRNVILIYDAADQGDTHHEHFRLVCLALKDADISLDIAGCIFDSNDVLQAGFQLDKLSSGAVLVIDLMTGDDDDSDFETDPVTTLSSTK